VATTSGPCRGATERKRSSRTRHRLKPRAARWLVAVLFVALLAAFAAGIWGTLLRPAAYEVRGTIASRPASNLLLVNHEAVEGLGMGAMELMAVFAEPALLDAADPRPGDRVRLAVRRENDRLLLLRIEKLR
jgi:hypothetical protein